MKFRIKRTSSFYATEKPCERAYGGNPLKENSEKKVWYIDINSIEELVAFRLELQEPIIIGDVWEEELGDMPEIEIYDDYRE